MNLNIRYYLLLNLLNMPSHKDQSSKSSRKIYNTRSSKTDEKLKKTVDSDGSDVDGDDSTHSDTESESDAMDMHEYRKFVNKIFPSKFLTDKIKTETKLKKQLQTAQCDANTEEDIGNMLPVNKKTSNKKNPTADTTKPYNTRNSKNKTSSKNKMIVVESETEESDEAYETVDDDDDSSDDQDDNRDKTKDVQYQIVNPKGKQKGFNIIFTIRDPMKNTSEDDDEYEDEDDDEYEDED